MPFPRRLLIDVADYRTTSIRSGWRQFQEAVSRPEAIAAAVDAWYDKDISSYSERGRAWAAENSWEKLGPKYLEVLKG